MVLFGLTVVVSENNPNTAVSLLILSFLVPAVLFSAVAGVYVDRVDRRLMLIATNVLRGLAIIGLFLVGDNLLLLLLLNIFVSTVTVFFAPAEAAMIPEVVPRSQLLAANGVFTLTLNAAFALGFALLGPLVINIAGPQAVILVVAALYFLAAGLLLDAPAIATAGAHGRRRRCRGRRNAAGRRIDALPAARRARLHQGPSVDRLVAAVPRHHGVARRRARRAGSRLRADGTRAASRRTSSVIVLPLGAGIVMGILLLNSYGQFLPRRRVIEGGLVALGVMLALLSVAGPISQFLQRVDQAGSLLDLSAVTSLLAIVVFIAFVAGIAYCGGGDPGPDPAPGGPAGGRPRPRLRRPEHAGVRRRASCRSSSSGRSRTSSGRDRDARSWRSACSSSGVASVFLRDPNLGRRRRHRGPACGGPDRRCAGSRSTDVARRTRRTVAACCRPRSTRDARPAARPRGPSDPADRD